MPEISLPCDCCGRNLSFPEANATVICPACSTCNARPHVEGASLEVLRHAIRQRIGNDFANAERSYQQVLMQYPESHEALWGRLLCHYGIEYVKNPATQRPVPVLHTPRPEPLRVQPEYKDACAFAPDDVQSRYENQAAYIDDIQAAIRQTAAPDCLVFICDDAGAAAPCAPQLYQVLKAQGLKPFYAPETLAGLTGAQREAGIYHALHKCPVMLIPFSSEAALAPVGVHSAWSRYLKRIGAGEAKQLLPLYYDGCDDTMLPETLSYYNIHGFSMQDADAMRRLLDMLRNTLQIKAAPPAPQSGLSTAVPTMARGFSIRTPHTAASGAAATATTDNRFTTAPCENGCMITKYNGTEASVTIPSYIGGQRVVTIGSRAFYRAIHLQSLTLPQGLTTIGERAFEGCTALTTLHLPWTLTTLDKYAFTRCSALQSVSLPNNLQTIAQGAFSYCTSLQRINIPSRVVIRNRDAFDHCPRLPAQTVSEINARASLAARMGLRG